MDTTYFGRKFGLMVFMDNTTRTVLYYAIVSHETNNGVSASRWCHDLANHSNA